VTSATDRVLEYLVRDVHGAQFQPLQAKRQHRFTGRVTLDLDPVGEPRSA